MSKRYHKHKTSLVASGAALVLAVISCARPEDRTHTWPADEREVLEQAKIIMLNNSKLKISDAMQRIATQGRDVNPAIAPEPSEDTSSLTGWSWGSGSIATAAAPGTMPTECEQTSDPQACWGEKLRNTKGCLACHSVDGIEQQPGPNWKNLFGHDVTLESGETVVVDEEYIRKSIKDPWSQIVQGYGRTMPPQDLNDDEIAAVAAYVKSISDSAPTKKADHKK